ncbi:hypothetical protein CEXT_258351 [Caerostris extrusa]|uniref:Uncharacterized protein n=1 Tax=Caerostris extrusa TaxID=172846 RepID=A0AAV4VVM5_CAEEX|nr:hypothetical protein CEXT_258351 [Caerostris extrusa]
MKSALLLIRKRPQFASKFAHAEMFVVSHVWSVGEIVVVWLWEQLRLQVKILNGSWTESFHTFAQNET